jgi:lysocardiolipin and lysophospholipid acyltransferase
MSQMTVEGHRLRKKPSMEHMSADVHVPHGKIKEPHNAHPLGKPKHGALMQLLRIVGFALYFLGSCLFIHLAQLLGTPLYFFSKDDFYAYMALTKQYFGLLVTTMTQWWSPTIVRISGDKSVAGQLHQKADGSLRVDFPDRIVLLANHQIYTDWLYLWWIAYTNTIPTHGHIYIILKESLKWVPIIGPAMQLYGFVFMARKWAKDQERLHYRLQKLNSRHSGPMSGEKREAQLDPMWLLIFPEGTNLSANTRKGSAKFAAKSDTTDLKHQILPRSTGLQFCLQELRNTVDYVYDCTIAYEGIPLGGYGQDVFTLRSVYFQGRPPKSVNMHWRRFAVKDMPIDDKDAMHEWTLARWREKDDLLAKFQETGKFPAAVEAVSIENGPEDEFKTPYINTEVKPRSLVEFMQIFAPVSAAGLLVRIMVQITNRLLVMAGPK